MGYIVVSFNWIGRVGLILTKPHVTIFFVLILLYNKYGQMRMRPSSVALMKAPDDFTNFSMKIVSEFVLARIFVDSFVLDSKIKIPKKP